MKKISFAVLALAAVFAGTAFSQTDSFEREGSWNVHISSDNGVITGRLFEGSPAAKEELNDSGNQQIEDTKVLGVKVEFFRRGVNSFYITAARPIPIEGVTKTVSIWACGRNMGHQLWLLVQDYNGNNFGWVHWNSADGKNLQPPFLLLQIASMELFSRVYIMEIDLDFALLDSV